MPEYDDHDLSHDEAEAEARRERREAEWRDTYFEYRYPSILAAVKRLLSQEAGDALQMREDCYHALCCMLGEDISEFSHSQALKLAGVTPFDAWDVPTKKDDVK